MFSYRSATRASSLRLTLLFSSPRRPNNDLPHGAAILRLLQYFAGFSDGERVSPTSLPVPNHRRLVMRRDEQEPGTDSSYVPICLTLVAV